MYISKFIFPLIMDSQRANQVFTHTSWGHPEGVASAIDCCALGRCNKEHHPFLNGHFPEVNEFGWDLTGLQGEGVPV